jgi:hypothetical protein
MPQGIQLGFVGGQAPEELCAHPLGHIPAVHVGGGRQPLGRVLVSLAPVRASGDRDQRLFGALVVGVLLAAQMPAAALQRLLGIGPSAAERWAAGSVGTAYAVEVARRS